MKNFKFIYICRCFREYCSLILDRLQEEGIDLSNANSFDEIIKKICSSLESQCISDQSIEKEFIEHAIEVFK